jgi:hypothetical protein
LRTQLPFAPQVPPAGHGEFAGIGVKSQEWLALHTARTQALALGAGQSVSTAHA